MFLSRFVLILAGFLAIQNVFADESRCTVQVKNPNAKILKALNNLNYKIVTDKVDPDFVIERNESYYSVEVDPCSSVCPRNQMNQYPQTDGMMGRRNRCVDPINPCYIAMSKVSIIKKTKFEKVLVQFEETNGLFEGWKKYLPLGYCQ